MAKVYAFQKRLSEAQQKVVDKVIEAGRKARHQVFLQDRENFRHYMLGQVDIMRTTVREGNRHTTRVGTTSTWRVAGDDAAAVLNALDRVKASLVTARIDVCNPVLPTIPGGNG